MRRTTAVASAAGPPLEDERLSAPADGAGLVLTLELDGGGGTRQQLGPTLWALDGEGGRGQVALAQGKPLQRVVCDLFTARQVQVLQRATSTQRCPTGDTGTKSKNKQKQKSVN